MKIKLINNWRYKANWNKICHLNISKDFFNTLHILMGLFNFFMFIAIPKRRSNNVSS